MAGQSLNACIWVSVYNWFVNEKDSTAQQCIYPMC